MNHVLNGNQLQFNVMDILSIAQDYAEIGLKREELVFTAAVQYKHRDKHIHQHAELAQKIQAIKAQALTVDSNVVLRRVGEWIMIDRSW